MNAKTPTPTGPTAAASPIRDRRATREARLSPEELAQFRKAEIFLDDLTGLYNRRFLSHLFANRWADLIGSRRSLSLIILDLDRFKEVNDTYGHLAGDEVLRATAGLLGKNFRKEDFIIRYGGDEFVVVLPGTSISQARRLAERARQACASHRFVVRKRGEPIDVPVSFGLGVASCPKDGEVGDEILARADRRLYADKRRRGGVAVRRRQLRIAAGAVFAGMLLAASYLLPIDAVDLPPDAISSSGTTEVGTSGQDFALIEEKFKEQIRQLQAEVDSLKQTLARRQAGESRDEHAARTQQERIGQLATEIVELQTELETRPPLPAASTEADGSPTAEMLAGSVPDPTGGQSAGGAPDAVATPVAPPRAAPPHTPQRGTAELSNATGSIPIDRPDGPAETRPVPASPFQARYPVFARKMRKEATVVVRVTVDRDGRALHAEVVGERAGLGFDEAASSAAQRAVYHPGTRDGIPVEMTTLVSVRFVLRR